MSAPAVTKQGFLVKEGGANVKNWRKRWFVLSNNAIHYMKSAEDSTTLGTIYLEDITTVERTYEKPSQKFVFQLKGEDNARTWYLSATSEAEMEAWMHTIQNAIAAGRQSSFKAILMQYCIVECFVNRGIRVSGHVSPRLLAIIGLNIPHDQKRCDDRGWFCDKHMPLCSAINIFVAHGWKLKHMMESVSCAPIDDTTPQPVNTAIFYRAPPKMPPSTRSTSSDSITLPKSPSIEASLATAALPHKPLPQSPIAVKPSKDSLPPSPAPRRRGKESFFGNDAAVRHLMQEMGLDDQQQ